MDEISTWRLAAGLILLIAIGGTWGCAQEIEDIDRTQADKIDKEIFDNDDEWYMQQTIVDTGMEGVNIDGLSDNVFLTTMMESDLKRIRWTITEDVLYAHSTVELAEGLNEGFDEEDSRRTGVVAAYPIIDHFDIQRRYDPSTGEPTNQIVEDRSDREWHQRDYMRVDWSMNMVDGMRMLHGMVGQLSPVADQVPQDDDEVDPHRARITDDYIDTVSDYSYDPDIMTCFGAYGMDAVFSCEGGRVSVRTSMKKVPEEETYEPLNYVDADRMTKDGEPDGEILETASIFDPELGYRVEVECTDQVRDWMLQESGEHPDDRCSPARFQYHERFGFFRTERVEWDRYVGTSDDQRRYYVNRWNIWQDMVDENGETIDPEDRTPKPVTFHKNLQYPKFMFDAAERTADEWNEVFRETVKLAMEIDDGKLDEILEEEYGHTEMFRIVQNSCHPEPLTEWFEEYGDHQSEDRMVVEDILYDYTGMTATGPETVDALWELSHEARENMCGELEYATADRPETDAQFDWERRGDVRYSFFNWVEEDTGLWAGYGPSAADPKTGEIIRANANYAGKNIRQNATYAADVIQYFNNELSTSDILHGVQIRDDLFSERDSEQLGLSTEAQREMRMRAGADPDETSQTDFEERPDYEDLDSFIHTHGLEEIQRQADIAAAETASPGSKDEQLIEFLETPRIKDTMMNSPETSMAVKSMARERHGEDFDNEQLHQAYLDFHTPWMFNERRQKGERMLSERSIMTHDDVAQSAEMLATYQGAADFFAGQPREDIIEYFLNEMFIGTQLHEIGHAIGLRHNFGGHADALNYHDEFWKIQQAIEEGVITPEEAYSLQDEIAEDILGQEDVDYASQSEYKLSTVMDYTGDLTGRFAGLGKYDEAAIKFAYGEQVEQWSEDVELPTALTTRIMLSDYTELPYLFVDGEGPEAFAEGVDILMNEREYVSIDDAREQRREDIIDNTEDWLTYDFGNDDPPAFDRDVDYEMCSDEFEGRRLDCAAFAYGGSQTEMVNHAFDTFRAFQPFWRHRRHNINRQFQNVNTYMRRLMRTFQIAEEPFRYYSLYRWFDVGDFTEDLERASIDSFNFYNEVMSMPEPGRHCKFDEDRADIDTHWFYNLDNTYVPANYHADEGGCSDYVDVPRGIGHEYNFKFTDEYMYRIDRVGTYIDKLVASQLMFLISGDFAQSAFFTDRRATNISYWTVFQDEMLEMLSGVMLGDYSRFGAQVKGGKVDYYNPVDPQRFGTGIAGEDDDLPRLFTPQSVNHELNVAALGLIYNSTWEDRATDFTHYVKVATNEQEAQQFGEGVETVEFVHPTTQQVYTAADIEGNSVGARMIERSNELAERYTELDAAIEEAENNGELTDSERAQLESELDRRHRQMEDMVAKMNMTRDLINLTDALR